MDAAPLIITTDVDLLDELLRLCAAAGCTPEVAHEVASALAPWSSAPLVIVGPDLVGRLAEAEPPGRADVVLASFGEPPTAALRAAVTAGVQHLAELPASEDWLLEHLAEVEEDGHPGAVIGVVGGSGGVGASVFAVSLACCLARRGPTLLADLDPLGPGLDRLLGLEDAPGSRWDDLQQTSGRFSARQLRDVLPGQAGLSVLTWPVERPGLTPYAVREVLRAGRRGFAATVFDLPRHLDAPAEEVVARCDQLVLVSGRSVAAIASAARLIPRLRQAPGSLGAVVRTAAEGEARRVAEVLGVPLLGALRDQRGLDEALDLGAGPVRSRRGALSRTAVAVAELLGTAA